MDGEAREDIAALLGSGEGADRRRGLALAALAASGRLDMPMEERLRVVPLLEALAPDEALPLWLAFLASGDKALADGAAARAASGLPADLRRRVAAELLGRPDGFRRALGLIEAWKDVAAAREILPRLKTAPADLLPAALRTLAQVQFSYFQKHVAGFLGHGNEEVRHAAARLVLDKGGKDAPAGLYRSLLGDASARIRRVGLSGARLQADPSWIGPLAAFLRDRHERDERLEAVRVLGRINRREVAQLLVELILSDPGEDLQWAGQQALETLDQDHRLAVLSRMLHKGPAENVPRVIELLGHCEGRKPFLVLKAGLLRHKDPAIRALLAAAMGTIGHRDCEAELLALMEEDLVVAYAACAALRLAARDRVLFHYEDFLRREGLSNLLRQTVIQHIGETALTQQVPPALTRLVEGFLDSVNDNIRYLSANTLGHIADPASIPALLPRLESAAFTSFRAELIQALVRCGGGRATPFLAVLADGKAPPELGAGARTLLAGTPLVLSEADLRLLEDSPALADWAWDEVLAPAVVHTHAADRRFVWLQLARKDLRARGARLLARGLEAVVARERDLLDPRVLLDAFSRYQDADVLARLARLMAAYGHEDFILPLLRFSEGTGGGPDGVFRRCVRDLVLAERDAR